MSGITVKSRQEFIDHLFRLMDGIEVEDNRYVILEKMVTWMTDCGVHYQGSDSLIDVEQPTWQLFADAVSGVVMEE